MFDATNKLTGCSCFFGLSTEKKVALASEITGIALASLVILAFLVPLPGSLSFFNQPNVKIVTTCLAGSLIAAPAIFFAIKWALRTCEQRKIASDPSILEEKDPLPIIQRPPDSEQVTQQETLISPEKQEVPTRPKKKTVSFADDPKEESKNSEKIEVQDEKESENLQKMEFVADESAKFISHLRKKSRDAEYPDFAFNNVYGRVCTKLKITRKQLIQGEIDWYRIEAKIKKWASQAYELQSTEIVWVTGSQSSALLGIGDVAKKGFTQRPALVPTGKLLSWNIVPFTGEISWGIRPGYVNNFALSGSPSYEVAYQYSQKKAFQFDENKELKWIMSLDGLEIFPVLLRLKIAVLRLIHSGANAEMLKQAKKHIETKILPKMKKGPDGWQKSARLIGSEIKDLVPLTNEINHPLPKGSLVGVERSDGTVKFGMVDGYSEVEKRYSLITDCEGGTKCPLASQITVYDPNALSQLAEKSESLPPESIETIKASLSGEDEHKEEIESILKLFDTEKMLKLSEQEKTFLQKPFPLVWATTSESELEFSRVDSCVAELAFHGNLQLGEEVKIVFTKAKKIKELRLWLQEQKISSVKVMSLGTMVYLDSKI